jgi:glucose-6-phosphate isomerase
MSTLIHSDAWKALVDHVGAMQGVHMRDLFAREPSRFDRFSLEVEDVLVDYSKNRVSVETMALLFALAKQAQVFEWRDRMMTGDRINRTENRAVLHVALRNRSNRPIRVDGQDVMPEVNAVLAKMRKFTDAVRSGEWAHGKAHHRCREHRHRRQ